MNEIKYVKHSEIEPGENCRRFFNPVTQAELKESIRQHGVRRNLEVEQVAPDRYRLVTGERRWRAVGELLVEINGGDKKLRAEREQMPVMVLSKEEVPRAIELNLVENLQRDNITPAEEAEGYALMLQRINPDTGANYTAKEIAQKVSEKESYVRRRLKLRNAPEFYLDAVNAGTVAATCAELIGKLPDAKSRETCARLALKPEDYEVPLGYEQLKRLIREKFMIAIKGAPFDASDANLVPEQVVDGVRICGGACPGCPWRSGNNAELQSEFSVPEGKRGGKTVGVDPNLCTNPACYRAKVDAHWIKIKTTAEGKGQRTVEGEVAKEIFGGYNGTLSHADYRDPSAGPSYGDLGYYKQQVPTWRELARKAGVKPDLVWNPFKNEAVELFSKKAVVDATLEKAGKKKCIFTKPKKSTSTGAGPRKTPEELKEEAAQRDLMHAIDHRATMLFLEAIREGCKEGPKAINQVLRAVCGQASYDGGNILMEFATGEPCIGFHQGEVWRFLEKKMKADGNKYSWFSYLAVMSVAGDLGMQGLDDAEEAQELAKALKIDIKKLRETAAAELAAPEEEKPKDSAKRLKTKTAKKATKKKGSK